MKQAEMPWGGYGSILVEGMSCHLSRKDGLIQLERTGPFIPSITFPGIGDIVVTNEFRERLQTSDLKGLVFQKVIKRHIVRLHWHKWDRSAPEPKQYPSTGEPEDYILRRKHSPEMAKAMAVCGSFAHPEPRRSNENTLPGSG